MDQMFNILAAFIGASSQEVIHWFGKREKLDDEKYSKLMRSRGYWAITSLMIIFSTAGTWILYRNRINAPDAYFVMGASFPLIYKKIVGVKKKPLELGEDDSYFD